MVSYFNTFKKLAELGTDYKDDIVGLTKAVALSGGIVKKEVQLKNGKKVKVPVFTKKFDDILVSQWYMYFAKTFFSVYRRHPELNSQWSDIVPDTFTMFFKYIKTDQNLTETMVTKYFDMTLRSRIANAYIKLSTDARMQRFQNDKTVGQKASRNRVVKKNYMNAHAVPFTKLQTYIASDKDVNTYSIVMDLKHRLQGNPYGKLVLDSCLYSNKKVNTNNLLGFIALDESEQTFETKLYIIKALNTIKRTLIEYCRDSGKDLSGYDLKPIKNVQYTKKEQNLSK